MCGWGSCWNRGRVDRRTVIGYSNAGGNHNTQHEQINNIFSTSYWTRWPRAASRNSSEMARGLNPQAASAPLPVVSFVKVQDDVTAQPPGVHDHQARSYGCACIILLILLALIWHIKITTFPSFGVRTITFDTSVPMSLVLWKSHRSDNYFIRTPGKWTSHTGWVWYGWARFEIVSSSFQLPEISTDLEWLNAVNSERKKEQLNQVTCETFEIVMDRLEKEWFDLVGISRYPSY